MRKTCKRLRSRYHSHRFRCTWYRIRYHVRRIRLRTYVYVVRSAAVSTAVPCDVISWTWYQSSTISRAYAAAGTGTSDPVPPNQVHNMLYSVRYHLKQTHHYRTMYPREEQVVPMFVPHIHEWSKWYLGSYHVSMIGASGTYDRTM